MLFLCCQGLAFRGHDETTDSTNQEIYSKQ